MGFIGKNGVPAPKLKDTLLEDPKTYFKKVVNNLRNMYSCGLVHGDLSEYNILDAGKPVFIDYSMGVTLKHPLAQELLERDVKNITKFFAKHDLKIALEDVLKKIKSSRGSSK